MLTTREEGLKKGDGVPSHAKNYKCKWHRRNHQYREKTEEIAEENGDEEGVENASNKRVRTNVKKRTTTGGILERRDIHHFRK